MNLTGLKETSTSFKKIWTQISALIPSGVHFFPENQARYDELCRYFGDVWTAMPALSGFKPEIHLIDLNDIARSRLNADEDGEIESVVYVDEMIREPQVHLEAYTFQFQKKRREFVKNNATPLIESISSALDAFDPTPYEDSDGYNNKTVPEEAIANIIEGFKGIDVLLGSQTRTSRWTDMKRHLGFHQLQDILDIRSQDWPAILDSLEAIIHSEYDPLPVNTKDIDEIVMKSDPGKIITKLKWETLSAEMFERLIFNIFSVTPGYENTKWLTNTNASDRGRDLSTLRILRDSLSGQKTQRIVVQCKHWLKTSIGISDMATLKEQMKLWGPPIVDCCIIATSGRFTTDAIDYIEKHNQSGTGLEIEMWPESHLEFILARHPELVGEYRLR